MDWQELDDQIDELRQMLHLPDDGLLNEFAHEIAELFTFREIVWKDVWAKAGEIQAGFKGIKYPTKEGREAAWTKFNRFRDAASTLGQKHREAKTHESKQHRDTIRDLARQGTYSGPSILNFMEAIDPTTVEEMKEKGRVLKKAGEHLSEHKHEMIAEHKRECFELIREAQESQNQWWESYKEHRAARQDSWRERTKARIAKHREMLSDNVAKLEKMEAHAEKLREQISDAYSEAFAERATGWLAELEPKIDSLKEHIQRIEGWIDEDEEKLNR